MAREDGWPGRMDGQEGSTVWNMAYCVLPGVWQLSNIRVWRSTIISICDSLISALLTKAANERQRELEAEIAALKAKLEQRDDELSERLTPSIATSLLQCSLSVFTCSSDKVGPCCSMVGRALATSPPAAVNQQFLSALSTLDAAETGASLLGVFEAWGWELWRNIRSGHGLFGQAWDSASATALKLFCKACLPFIFPQNYHPKLQLPFLSLLNA